MTPTQTDTSVVVIGAGQAGLSVSYSLPRLGLDAGNDFVVLDREEIEAVRAKSKQWARGNLEDHPWL